MTIPTLTLPPSPLPATTQTEAVFDAAVAAYIPWSAVFADEIANDAIPWFNGIRDEVAATAMTGDLPALTGQNGNFVRVNSGATAAEFATPTQVADAIGIDVTLHPAKAFLRVASTGVIQYSKGIASASKLATGKYLVTLTHAAPSNFLPIATPNTNGARMISTLAISTTQFEVYSFNNTGAAADTAFFCEVLY